MNWRYMINFSIYKFLQFSYNANSGQSPNRTHSKKNSSSMTELIDFYIFSRISCYHSINIFGDLKYNMELNQDLHKNSDKMRKLQELKSLRKKYLIKQATAITRISQINQIIKSLSPQYKPN